MQTHQEEPWAKFNQYTDTPNIYVGSEALKQALMASAYHSFIPTFSQRDLVDLLLRTMFENEGVEITFLCANLAKSNLEVSQLVTHNTSTCIIDKLKL